MDGERLVRENPEVTRRVDKFAYDFGGNYQRILRVRRVIKKSENAEAYGFEYHKTMSILRGRRMGNRTKWRRVSGILRNK